MKDAAAKSWRLFVALKPSLRTDSPLRTASSNRVHSEAVPVELGLADQAALGLALRLREELHATGAEATLLAAAIGTASAEAILRTALAAGADASVRLLPPPEGLHNQMQGETLQPDASGLSTREKARALASLFRASTAAPPAPAIAPVIAPVIAPAALVLLGERSEDTAQESLGAFLAAALGWFFAHRVLELHVQDGRLRCQLERGYRQEMHWNPPAVFTISRGAASLPKVSLAQRIHAARATIPCASALWSTPSFPITQLRVPRPRVKRYVLPPSQPTAEMRISAMVEDSTPSTQRPRLTGTPEEQAEAIFSLLTQGGYRSR